MGTITNALKKIRVKVIGIPVLSTIGRPIYRMLVSNPELKHQKAMFRQNGLKVIEDFDKVMTGNGFRYYLYFGSLLGAVREHGLIKHDFDYDVAMLNSDFSLDIQHKLENAGFALKHEILVEEGQLGRHQNYVKDGVYIDIFWIYPPINSNPYCTGCSLPLEGTNSLAESITKYGGTRPVRIELPFNPEVRRVPFEHLQLPIPANADEILRICYGDDYMIPNPNWEEPKEISYKVAWKDKIGIVKKYE